MNILDLGFFAAIQSLQYRKFARSIDELIDNVAAAFHEYPSERLNHTFITLQSCMLETIKLFGDNTYKIPHLSKMKLARDGQLPWSLLCPRESFDNAMNLLSSMDCAELDRTFAIEMEAACELDDLSRELEAIALGGGEAEELLNDVGIMPIEIHDE
ncbi:Aste57867_14312 [Aphanomyces stellatus]|uniref:Aste57867_14312 protein n=1 Tax=Aphanomyces stellatus TaxID=120398 RepID=A0A485L162_9STRA|nr:hypothetical protein As57867_014259 [Aphanomyces stellatus]VFT91137.1 Aste57867_14312 [Aphanomyces stellatus]